MTPHVVEVEFSDEREGIELHRWFRDNCKGEAVVSMLEEGAEPVSLAEYNTNAGLSETLQAYSICEAWLNHHDLNGFGLRVEFESKQDALLFKLTFGGSL